MDKNYLKWHKEKKRINNNQDRVFFSEREVWFCHLGENVGFEQDGRGDSYLRPVIVLKKFNNEICWAIPLTKRVKPNRSFNFILSINKGVRSTAILSQIRLLDVKRLKYKIGTVRKNDFIFLKEKIRRLIA